MIIKQLKLVDLPLFKALRLEALLNHPEAFGSSLEEEENLSAEEWKINFEKSVLFGAFDKNELIACIGFFTHSPTKMKHKGVVFGLYTKQNYRNRQLGDVLLKKVIAYAKNKVKQLHLTVVTTNQVAIKLYQKNGFKIYGTEPHALKVGAEFHDEHLMILDF
jgi:RimJ/RimL family protein N-acetyltransferase